MSEPTSSSILHSVRTFQRALRDESMLRKTLHRMREESAVSPQQAAQLDQVLADMTTTTTYILRHLAVHLGIGASKMILPLPIGSFLRGSWVAIARLTETARRRRDRAGVHSLPVFLIACIPFFGYLAYIVALRRHDPDAALLYANHVAVLRYDRPLENVLADKPNPVQWIVRRAVGNGR